MSEAYVGEIILWPVSRIPENWLPCDGRSLAISEYDVLYALIGTIYGGDGSSTFAIPDLRGRVPVHQGAAPGMQSYQLGQVGGAETVTLVPQTIPPHNHPMMIASAPGTASAPTAGGALASMGPPDGTGLAYAPPGGSQVALSATGISGQGTAHANIQPSLAMNYIICAFGLWPPRP